MSVYQDYKKEIYRMGWRIQYKAKKVRSHELPLFDNQSIEYNFTNSSDAKIFVEELLRKLPSQGRTILQKIHFQDMTEKEIAKELHISQQAVSKCKKR